MKKLYLPTLFLLLGLPVWAQWSPVNNGLTNLTSGAKLLGNSNTHLFSGTLGGQKMYRTNTNGNNWVEIQPPVSGNVPECGHYFNGRYFSGLNASTDCIFYTTDNGTTWNSVSGGPQTTVVRGFLNLSGDVFAYTSSKGIYKSADGGSTWSAANTGLSNLNVAWMETLNSKLLAATIGGGVFISSDNGASWVQSNTGIASGDLNATYVWRMGTSLYYTSQGGGWYSSSNSGTNWTVWAKPAVMGLGINEIYRNGSNLYLESRHFAGGLRDSVYFSSNEGANWLNITGNLAANNLNASGITEFNNDVFIAYNIMSPNMGIYRRTASVGLNENQLSVLINPYPNPLQDKLFLTNQSPYGIVSVTIYDYQGKLVSPHHHPTFPITTSKLPDGMYLLHITLSDNTVLHKKLVK